MIIGKNITISFTGEAVLENINFKIGNNNKVALVGKNGCGKSTLFKIISKELIPDTGNVIYEEEKIGYIPQEIEFPNEMIGVYLEEKLDNSWDFYKVEQLINDLDFKNFDPYQEIHTLSEGQKMKLKILEILIDDPTTLLIDEPTNHLDIEGIMWFEKYIKKLNKTVLIISHDRQFLNNTVDKIWEIENKKLIEFSGNYDDYKEQKLKLIDKWNAEYVRFLKKKAQLEELLRKTQLRMANVQYIKSRIKREVEDVKKEKYINKKMQHVDFETGITHAKLMIDFQNITKKYNENTVFEDLSFMIRGGEKVWLFGPNGAGKSTIVKMIIGEENPTSGDIKIGKNIEIGYFAQKQTYLDYNENLIDYYIKETGSYEYDVYAKLKKYLFEKDDLKKKIKNLSPGERARYAFAIFADKNYDMLILDEPDNHLDIDTKEILEESLRNYKGTLLLISHDRFFVESVGIEKIFNLKDGLISQY